MLAVAEIAGVGLGEKKIDHGLAADLMRQRKSARLVDPHQRRMDDEAPIHAERQRQLHRLDGVVAAIRIAGEVGFAHAGNEVLDAAPIGDRAGEGKEHEVAAGHECRRQTRCGDFDRHFAGQRGFRNLRKRIDADDVIVAEPRAPLLRVRRETPRECAGARQARRRGAVHKRTLSSRRAQSARAPRPGTQSNPARRKTGRARCLADSPLLTP